MPFRTIEVALRANIAGFQAEMGAAAASVKAFGNDVGGMLSTTDAETKKAVETVSRGALVMGAGLLAGFGVAVGAAANFQKEMSGVQAVSGATGAEMKLLGESALKAGADTSFSASEAARAQGELAKAGISTSDILGGALTGSLALAAAGQLDLGQAAEISAQAMNIFGLEGTDVSHIADVLAAGANKSAADVGQLGDALRQGGLVAHQTGLSFEETVATLAAFADNALIGSDAGTSLKTMLQRLTPTSKESAEQMALLGFSAYDASGNFVGMEALAGELQSSLAGLTAEERNTALAVMFGSDAVRAANIVYKEGPEGIRGYISAVNEHGFATRMAAQLTNNLAGDVERLGGSLETALIRGGSGANAVLREMVQFATGAVNAIGELPTPLLAVATGFAGISGSALLVLGGVGTLIPKLKEVQLAMASMGSTGIATAGILSTLGKALGIAGVVTGLAIAFSALGKEIDELSRGAQDVDAVTASLIDLAKGAGSIDAVGAAARGNQGDLREFLDLLNDPRHTQAAESGLKRRLEDIDAGLRKIVEGGAPDLAAEALRRFAEKSDVRVEEILPYLTDYEGALKTAAASAQLSAAAVDEAGRANGGLAGSQEVLNEAMRKGIPITEAQKAALEADKQAAEELAKVHTELGEAMGGFIDPMDAWNTVMERNTDSMRKHAEGVAAGTADAKDSWEDYATGVTASLSQYADELQKQVDAQNNWADNLRTIAARGRADVAKELSLMGPEGAALVAAFANSTDAEMARAGDLVMERARQKYGAEGLGRELDNSLKIAAEIGANGGQATAEAIAGKLGVLPEEVRRIAEDMNVKLRDTLPAWQNEWVMRRTVTVDEMNAILRDAPPVVGEAAQTVNRFLADNYPEFAAQMASRHGITMEQMGAILRDAPPPVREAFETILNDLAGQLPGFNDQMLSRYNVTMEQMGAIQRDGPPVVRQAAEDVNRYLADNHPEFSNQMHSRYGVTLEQMNKILTDAPPPVRDAFRTILDDLAGNHPAFADQMIGRYRVTKEQMDAIFRDAPPPVRQAFDDVNRFLAGNHPEFTNQMNSRYGVTLDQMRAILRDAPPPVRMAFDDIVTAAAERLPPFERTVGGYQNTLVNGIQTVAGALFTRTGGPGSEAGNAARRAYQADGGIVEFFARGGMKEAHQAQIARAGDWRVWAEPETGGEAYIPLALAKRERSTGILEEVASRFGLVLRPAKENEVLDYHQGGICGHSGCQYFHSGGLYVPPPHPQFADYGPPIRPAGSGTTHNMQEMAAEFARRHMQEPHHTAPPPAPGGGGGFSGGNTLARVNSILGEFPGLRVTSTYRSPGANAAVGGAARSYHMDRANPAVDVGGPTAQLDRYAARLRGMGGWREGPIWRAPGHYDHVHVAEHGGIFKSYDQGGWLEPGYTLAHNGTGRPERVLSLAEGGLVGDTFYGGAGSERKRQRRFSDEEGAQFDYMNRRETRATPHAYLDYGTPHNRRDGLRPSEAYRDEWNDAMRDGRTGGAGAGTRPSAPAVIPVPVNQSADNSVNLTFSGPAVKVDVSASVGADARQLQDQVLTAVNRSLGAWQDSLKAEIRSRRG